MLTDLNSEFFAWVRGGLFMMFLFHIVMGFQNKRPLYFYYSGFIGCELLYLLRHVIHNEGNKEVFEVLSFLLLLGSFSFLVQFIREYLETRKRDLVLDAILVVSLKTMLILGVLLAVIDIYFGFDYQLKAFALLVPLLNLLLVFILLRVRKLQGKHLLFFSVSTLFYLLAFDLSFLQVMISDYLLIDTGIHPLGMIYIALFCYSLILALIMGFSVKEIEQKSKNAELKLALKLKEMEELKMTALQSQMNPHFLFNSLNSINNFVLKSEVEKASDYITKFAKLIRVILNSSSSPTVRLSEELKTLALYVKLEQIRITGGFTYLVTLDEEINYDHVFVPPLFLQPFIENAIWHGITKVEGYKEIHLYIKKEENTIKCEIIDNGIGINSAKKHSHISQRRKFYGAEATENRIKVLHKNKNVQITTTDVSEEGGTGTHVSITFPYD
ncbi:MAG: histidine kinase [Flavobacteriaceae bacterium]|nr:histidine kinase [Flavobacteriaceae bacterium]